MNRGIIRNQINNEIKRGDWYTITKIVEGDPTGYALQYIIVLAIKQHDQLKHIAEWVNEVTI